MMLDRMIGYSYCKHVMHSPLLHILLQKIRRQQQRNVPNRRSRCSSYTQKEFSKSERNQPGPFGDIRLKKKDATTVYNQSFTDTMKQRNEHIQLLKFVTDLDSGVAILTISRKQYKHVFIFRLAHTHTSWIKLTMIKSSDIAKGTTFPMMNKLKPKSCLVSLSHILKLKIDF